MDIRKVSVGPDYKSGAMHYQVGQQILKGTHTIHLIKPSKDGSIQIWVENDNEEIFLWKGFTVTMPISIEYNINFT